MSVRTVILIVALVAARAAAAQDLLSQPLTLADGHVVIGADTSFSVSTQDDELAWFNYTDYEHNTMRLVRLGVTTNIRLNDRVSFLREVRSENSDAIHPYALYARVRPWKDRAIDIQAGPHSAHLRRLCATRVCERQSADRLPAGLSISDLTAARRHPA